MKRESQLFLLHFLDLSHLATNWARSLVFQLLHGSINASGEDGLLWEGPGSWWLELSSKDLPRIVSLNINPKFWILRANASTVGMYVFSRMVLGFGIVFCIISGSSLIGELGHPNDRPTLTSLFNASYFIGQITASAISLATTEILNDWGWRIPSLLQMAPSVLQIAFIL